MQQRGTTFLYFDILVREYLTIRKKQNKKQALFIQTTKEEHKLSKYLLNTEEGADKEGDIENSKV